VSTQALRISAGSLAVLAVCFAGFICLGLPDGTLGVAWPSLRDLFGRVQADFGLVLLAHGGAYFLSGLLGARLIGRFSSATLLSGASLAVAMGMLSVAAAPTWWLFLGAVVLIGAGSGVINTTINTYASQNFSPRHVNWLHACYSLGAAIGPLAMTAVIANHASWHWGYVLLAVAPVSMALIYLVTARHWQPTSADMDSRVPGSPAQSSGLLVRQAVLFFCYSGLELTFGRWCYTVLTEWHHLAAEPAGLATSCFFGSVFAGRLLLGAALDRVGATRMVRLASALAVVGASIFAVGGGGWAAVGLVLAGFGLAPIFPTLVAQSAGRFPRTQLARVIAICVAAAILGSAVVPYLAGVATTRFGLGAIATAAVILALALVVMHESIAGSRNDSLPK
jgi:fucose permease